MSALSSASSTRAGPGLPSASRGPPPAASAAGAASAALSPGAGSPGSQRIASSRNGLAAVGTARDPPPATTLASGRCPRPNGILTVNVAPARSAPDAVMVPPCSATSSRTRASPMPLPSLDRDGMFSIRWKRSNRRGISAAAIPTPVSATRSTACPSSSPSRTLTVPSKVNFSALLSRLKTTFSHISRST